MRSLILTLLIGVAFSVSLPKDQKPVSEKYARRLYEEFKRKYNKDYMNDEHEKRFTIFRDNLNLARYYQSQERGTAEYGVTRFSDLTPEEFVKMYASAPAQASLPDADLKYDMENMPKSVDWRKTGAVTPVEDQGPCGSCWAFSAIGNVEGQWFLKTGKSVRLSKQQLLDCDKTDMGCFGGLPMNAYKELKSMGGVQSEDTYPYEAQQGECKMNGSEFVAHVSGSLALSTKEREQAAWLSEHGPISVGLNAKLLQFYIKGVIFPWPFMCPASGINHGVLTVGYEDSFFLPHWIVKNSWGAGWGEQGYFRIFKGLGSCGINQMATTAIV